MKYRSALGLTVALIATFGITGCATKALSFVESGPISRTDFNLYPISVVAIDGRTQFSGPYVVEPGERTLVLAGPGPKDSRLMRQKAVAFKVAPCTRYTLTARKESPADADWTLMVERTEALPGCKSINAG